MGAYSNGMFTNGEILDAIYVHDYPYGTSHGNLRVYIPRPMPDIASGYCRAIPQVIDSSTIANTAECRPNVASRIDSQNWYTASAPNFPYAGRYIYFGAGLRVRVIINDTIGLDFKLVSEEMDPSWDPPDD